MKKTSARGFAGKRVGKTKTRMKITVEAHLRWRSGSLDEETIERIADAFHARERERRIYDVSVGGSMAERWLDVSFGLAHVEACPFQELVSTVREIIDEALRGNVFPAGVPPAHIIDAMAFKPVLSQHSS